MTGIRTGKGRGKTSSLYRYCWGNNSKRETLQGRICTVLCRGTMNSAYVEFTDNGQREVISRNALRRVLIATA